MTSFVHQTFVKKNFLPRDERAPNRLKVKSITFLSDNKMAKST